MASIHGEGGYGEIQSLDGATIPASPRASHQKHTILENGSTQAQKRFEKVWRKMLDLREEVTQARLALREVAARLKEPRSQLLILNTKLYGIWQRNWNNATEPSRDMVTELYESIQKHLDEVGPLEETYIEQEDELHSLEYRLGEIEERVYGRAVTLDPQSGSHASSSTSPSIRERSPGYDEKPSDAPKDEDAVQRYLDRVGDANIVRERIAQLQQDRDYYIETAKQRAAVGVPQYQPNIEFLADFDSVFEENMQELNTINQDIQRLAVAADIEAPSSPATEVAVVETDDSLPLAMRATWPLPSDTPKEAKPKRSFSYDDLSELRKNDKINLRERINSWILERLRTSRMERLLDSPDIRAEERWDAIVHSWPWESQFPVSSPPPTASCQTQTKSSSAKPTGRSIIEVDKANPPDHGRFATSASGQSKFREFRTAKPASLRSAQTREDADWDWISDFKTSHSH